MLAGCCSAKTVPARRSCSCSGCARRPPRGWAGSVIEIEALRALAASGEEDAPAGTLAGRSPWPARRAMPGRSPARARR